ncbi:MAG: hypothetical protein ACOCRX_06985 [Candidatus Woesearchaeota archaeon]
MKNKKYLALKKIQAMRNSSRVPDFMSMKKEGFEKGILKTMIKEELIGFRGTFFIKSKGERALRYYLMKESNNKKKGKVMFDNDILNKIVEGELNMDKVINSEKFEFCATHIQTDQLSRCPNKDKRAKLTLEHSKLSPRIIPTETTILDISRINYSKLGKGEKYKKIKKDNPNHIEDALIGETAIENNILLVTNDKKLRRKVKKEGGKAIGLKEFKKLI